MTVTGPDRLSWLHSITSQDLTDLAPRTSTELLVLSPQGHVEHAASVVDDGTTTWLVTERSHAADLAAWLDRMKFMLRVEIADATDEWAALGEPVDAEGTEDEPVTWRDPWPHVLAGGTRYGRPRTSTRGGAPVAARARPARGAGRLRRGARGRRVAPRGHVGERGRPRRGLAPAARDGGRPPVDPARDRLAAHRGPPAQGLLPGAGDHRARAQPRRPPRRVVMLHLDGSGHLLPAPGPTSRSTAAPSAP